MMETQKLGIFLKELRKEKGLTQEQLGEKIGVTNKTVSRWETGTYVPPVENLKQLSDIYQISINEILAGERLDSSQYPKAAEENISVVLEDIELQNKQFENKMILTMIITSILAVAIILLLPKDATSIIIILMVVAMAVIANILNIVALSLKKNSQGDN